MSVFAEDPVGLASKLLCFVQSLQVYSAFSTFWLATFHCVLLIWCCVD